MSMKHLQRDVQNGNRLLVDKWEDDVLFIDQVHDHGVSVTPIHGGESVLIDMSDGVPRRYDVVDAAGSEYDKYVQQAVKAGYSDSFAIPESVVVNRVS